MLIAAALLLALPGGVIASQEPEEQEAFPVFATPEPSRAVLLVIGSAMVLFCYRRAWTGRRPS